MSSTTLIIGFCGYARSGKDTACEFMLKNLKHKNRSTKIYSFGDSLRSFAFDLNVYIPELKMYYQDIINLHGYENAKDNFPEFRSHLVKIGNGARKNISQDIWLNSVKEKIEKDNCDVALIKDVRYSNEVEFILNNGGIIVYIDRLNNGPSNNVEKESIKKIINKFNDCDNFITVENKGDIKSFHQELIYKKIIKS